MKTLFFLFLAFENSMALDMSNMVPVFCERRDFRDTSYNSDGKMFNAKTNSSCGGGVFCYTEATCLYIDKKLLTEKYGNDLNKAHAEETRFSKEVKNVWSEFTGKNPDSLESAVNIACFSEKSTSCPPLLDCIKSGTVSEVQISDRPTKQTILKPNTPEKQTK